MSSTSTDAPLLRAEKLGRRVGEKVLVEDVSFALHRGEVLAVFGPSGSGKSSLLRLLNRLDEPTSGTAFIESQDYRTMLPQAVRRKLGMVTQRPFLFPGTVADNIRFGPAQRGQSVSEAAVEELLARVGLPKFGDREVARLSGGEAQRVSFARTLANAPIVMLLDEPTSALDEAAKRGIEGVIQKIAHEQGIACVLVSHDREQVARLSDRTLLLRQGEVVTLGATAEVLHA
ncbi:MAG: ATP-binding cassette domain-containing protein [Acidobacteriales bacterium]|nr:ATP-binding cassette domain-containing protein [Terriglobales bacterium]